MANNNNEITEKNKILLIAEKVKAFAMVLIGSLFFTLGFSYFQEQEEYRVPRILMPIFELFGNIGLAIGLVILGAALMYFAYHKFIKFDGKPIVMMILIPLFIISAFVILKLSI